MREFRRRVADIRRRKMMLGSVKIIKVSRLRADKWRDILPPLSDEEREGLHADIKRSGVLEPLEVSGRDVVDGHNRYDGAIKAGITELPCQEGDWKDGDAIKEHILRKQLHRRNLNPEARRMLIGQLYNLRKGSQGGDRKSKEAKNQSADSALCSDTAKQVSAEAGISPRAAKSAGKEAAFKGAHPEFKGDPQMDTMSLEIALALLDDEQSGKWLERAQIMARVNGAERMTAREVLLALKLFDTGICGDSIDDALQAALDGTAKTLLEDNSTPEEVQTSPIPPPEPEEAGVVTPAPPEFDAVKVRAVLDSIALTAASDDKIDTDEFPYVELADLYRLLYGEELFGDETYSAVA